MSRLGPAIAAVSSPPGRGVRGLVRVSGKGLAGALPQLLGPVPPERVWRACRLKGGGDLAGLAVTAAWFAGPASYTAEDILEIQAPGHPALLDRLVQRAIDWLKATVDSQARRAEAGEFTRRAFLSGKIDLAGVESIAAMLSAESRLQVEAAGLLRSGRLGREAGELTGRLAELLALVEAGIDFSDQDDVVTIETAVLERGLREILSDTHRWLENSRLADECGALPRVVLAGVPNVGKSTLFNALAGYERGVSHETPGSTRDVLVEAVRLPAAGGKERPVLLADVAGLEIATDALAEAMQTAARREIRQADLVLLLESQGLPASACDVPDGKLCLRVWTQADRFSPPAGWPGPAVSARTGEGLDSLRREISARLEETAGTFGAGFWALQQKHRESLENAVRLLEQAAVLAVSASPQAPELAAEAMRRALDALGAVGGPLDPDEVIGLVFSKFCVGK